MVLLKIIIAEAAGSAFAATSPHLICKVTIWGDVVKCGIGVALVVFPVDTIRNGNVFDDVVPSVQVRLESILKQV